MYDGDWSTRGYWSRYAHNYTENNRGSKIWQVSGQFISINSVIFKSCPCFIKPCCFYTEKGNVILVVLIYPNTLQSVRFSAQCPLGCLNPVERILWFITQKRIGKPTPKFALTLFQVSEYINRTFATFWNLFLRTVWTVGVIQLRSNFLFYIFASTQRSSLMFLVALNWLLFSWIFSSGTALEVP